MLRQRAIAFHKPEQQIQHEREQQKYAHDDGEDFPACSNALPRRDVRWPRKRWWQVRQRRRLWCGIRRRRRLRRGRCDILIHSGRNLLKAKTRGKCAKTYVKSKRCLTRPRDGSYKPTRKKQTTNEDYLWRFQLAQRLLTFLSSPARAAT